LVVTNSAMTSFNFIKETTLLFVTDVIECALIADCLAHAITIVRFKHI